MCAEPMLACVSAQSITWVFALYIPDQAAKAVVCNAVFHVPVAFLSAAISAAVWRYALNTLVINNTYSTFREVSLLSLCYKRSLN